MNNYDYNDEEIVDHNDESLKRLEEEILNTQKCLAKLCLTEDLLFVETDQR